MSEKRFFTKINKNGRLIIIDKECHTEIIDLTFACEVLNILDGKLKIYNEQLGEQQSTIEQLQDLCGESDSENAKLRIENKKLKAKLKEKEEDEQLYANEIVKLNKEAKEVLDFKSLGGDY